MRWPWQPRPSGSTEARPEKAKRDLEATREQWPEVHRLVEELREHRRANHFAENVFKLAPGRDR